MTKTSFPLKEALMADSCKGRKFVNLKFSCNNFFTFSDQGNFWSDSQSWLLANASAFSSVCLLIKFCLVFNSSDFLVFSLDSSESMDFNSELISRIFCFKSILYFVFLFWFLPDSALNSQNDGHLFWFFFELTNLEGRDVSGFWWLSSYIFSGFEAIIFQDFNWKKKTIIFSLKVISESDELRDTKFMHFSQFVCQKFEFL